MKFTVSQAALARAISIVSKGITSNSTLPILSGIYLKANNGTLELYSSNLTISIKHQITANVEEPGETVVSGRMISNIVKNLPDEAVSFIGAGHVVDISCGRSRYHLNTLAGNDFPQFPELQLNNSIDLPADVLLDMVNKVYKVTSDEASRPLLSGILMTVEKGIIRLVATDAIRLCVCETEVEATHTIEDFQLIIPGTAFHDVLSLPVDEQVISVGSTDKQVVCVYGNTTYVSRSIEGDFPDYKQLLPPSNSSAIRFNVQDFTDALRRVSVVAINNPSIKFEFDNTNNTATISSISTDQGEASETLPVEIDGESSTIALNNRFVMDCLNSCPTDIACLELQTATQPAIFTCTGKMNYLYLLMPVRM